MVTETLPGRGPRRKPLVVSEAPASLAQEDPPASSPAGRPRRARRAPRGAKPSGRAAAKYVLQIKLQPKDRKAVAAAAKAAILPIATWARQVVLRHARSSGARRAELAATEDVSPGGDLPLVTRGKGRKTSPGVDP